MHLSNSSFRDDTDEWERVHAFGFAFPDSHRGEKQSHMSRRATHSLSKRSNASRLRMQDESVRVFNRLKNRRERKKVSSRSLPFVIRSINFANLHVTPPCNHPPRTRSTISKSISVLLFEILWLSANNHHHYHTYDINFLIMEIGSEWVFFY